MVNQSVSRVCYTYTDGSPLLAVVKLLKGHQGTVQNTIQNPGLDNIIITLFHNGSWSPRATAKNAIK